MDGAAEDTVKQLGTDQPREVEEHGLRAEAGEVIIRGARKSRSIRFDDPRDRNGKLATASFCAAFAIGDDAEVEPQCRGDSCRFGECTSAGGQEHS